MIGYSFLTPSYTKTSPAFHALLCCLASSAKLRGNLGSSPDTSITHLVPRSVARLSLLCWISSVKIILKYAVKSTACVCISNPHHLFILSTC